MREHVGLAGARAVDAGSGDDLEMLVETKMGQYALRGRLRLRGGHRESDTGGPQISEQWPDPVEEAVDRPTASKVWCMGGPTIRLARSPSGTAAPISPSACRKLDTMPSAESVSVPSRSKITSWGAAGDDARR